MLCLRRFSAKGTILSSTLESSIDKGNIDANKLISITFICSLLGCYKHLPLRYYILRNHLQFSMKYHFKLPISPESDFEIETSGLTGKSELFMNNQPIEQSDEEGRPFLIPLENGDFVKAYPRVSFPDFMPTLEIDGIKNLIARKLEWYEYAISSIPILLLFVGGALGGGIGAFGTYVNFNLFRQEGTQVSKYLKVIGVIIISCCSYVAVTALLIKLFQ